MLVPRFLRMGLISCICNGTWAIYSHITQGLMDSTVVFEVFSFLFLLMVFAVLKYILESFYCSIKICE